MMDGRTFRLVRAAQVLVLVGACTVASVGRAASWQPAGVGDCPARDVAGSRGPVPEAGKCDANFVGYTAVCWAAGCTYKKVATGLCTGGANPGQMYTCAATAKPAGHWQAVGLGDCSGRDVAGTTGPSPDPGKCTASFAGQTAVCWTTGCTYKNVATGACTGGANPGQMYTCEAAQPAAAVAPATGSWQAVGVGDCPGRDVAGTAGPNPDPGKCNASFAGQTAVCWSTGCTYKTVATGSCSGGANPGQMYTCAAPAAVAPPAAEPIPTGWQGVGISDCPGRDIAGSAGPVPDPAKCNPAFAGQTAVCWATGCTYKSVATKACTGGANPGQMYTCAPVAAPPAPPKLKGKHYSVVNYTGDKQNAHSFVVDWRACKIAELNQDFEHGQEDITVLACRPGSRLVFKTEFRASGYVIQYDWVMLDNGSTVAGSYRDPTSCGPSAGKAGK
jgi:hypothetical protein